MKGLKGKIEQTFCWCKKMKIKLKKPHEWGHFIDPESLEIKELIGEIPNNSLVIFRIREFKAELGRNVIITRYANISKNTLVYLIKRDFIKKLRKQIVQYMLNKNKIPPKVTFAKEITEKAPIELVYSFSSTMFFQMKITENDLDGKNPKEFFEKLITASDKDFFETKKDKRWKIEYAPNGRALCKKCRRQIKEKEVRLGEFQTFENQLIQQFYHFKCVDWSKQKEHLINGINDLTELDKQKLMRKLKSK
jgi:hypothetical protein